MYHKVLVKKFVLNTDNEPLKNEDGSIVTEQKVERKTKWEIVNGKAVLVNEDSIVEAHIIPTRKKESEFIIYQQIDDSNGSHTLRGYVDEQGNAIELVSSHEEVYEFSVIEQNSNPVFN